jgi:non-specific serine/threonine protein kinase
VTVVGETVILGESSASKAQEASGTYRYRVANAEYDEAQNVLWLGGQQVAVEPLPLQLLALLLRRADEVVTHAELIEALWQGRPTVEHVLANAVSKLRRALGDEVASRLKNVPRVGYRLIGPVERVAVGRKPLGTLSLSPGRSVPGREDFVLLHPLGDGSASTVWRARHRRLQQTQVFKFARDGDQLATLKREFTVYRVLLEELGRRADLVAVKESNFTTAPYFLAYEDAGTDLQTWGREQPHLAVMSAAERLMLFLQIAHAVAAAHSVGILHRDLKPANVLVDDRVPSSQESGGLTESTPGFRWQVKLTDFGSSHLLAPDRLKALGITAMGMTITSHPLLGATPHYLAPELLAGESPTMRSDLYALGLMLYQLLAGDLSRPLATGWEHDIEDPLLVDDVRAATEGRPERRLASVAQLIERLESLEQRRAQHEEAAEANRRMQMAADRLEQIRSRRPWLLALTCCIALGGLGAAWFGVQARAAQREAERATARARAINEFLNTDVLRSPSAMQVGAASPNVALIDVLAQASDRVGERFKDDMPVLAQVRRQLGDIYASMFYADQAEDEYRRAIAALEPLVRPDDAELLAARFGLVQALTAQDRPQQAMAKLELAERAAGPKLLEGSSPLAQRALRARVQLLMDRERYAQALPLAVRLVRLSDEPSDVGEFDAFHRLEARQWLCEIYAQLDDNARAGDLLQKLMSPPFNDRSAAAVLHARVQLRRARDDIRQDRWAEAESVLTQLRDTPEPNLRPSALHVGMLNSELFEVYRKGGRFQEALEASEAARRVYEGALGEKHSLVTISRINAALSELELGHAADALRDLEAARLRLDANGRYVGQFRAIDLGRARALASLGRRGEASELLRGLNLN